MKVKLNITLDKEIKEKLLNLAAENYSTCSQEITKLILEEYKRKETEKRNSP